jgi:TrpR-related protein YerC/YecD
MNQSWKNEKTEQLFDAFLQLKTTDEAAAFCRDLMTEAEIGEFAGRLDAAIELNEGKPQRQVSKETGVSIATVTRVNQWLQRGMNGYKTVISRLKPTKRSVDPTDNKITPETTAHHHLHRGG